MFSPIRKSWSPRTWAIGIFLITFLLFTAVNLKVPFILDDYYQVRDNPYLTSLRYLPRLLTTRVLESTQAETLGSDIYRPVFMASYLLDVQLFGARPAAFHIHNNLLHALNVALLFLLAVRFLPLWAAIGGALVFAVHPMVLEAVTWIGGRMDLQVCLFSLLHIHLALRLLDPARRSSLWWWILYWLTIPLGLFSKETFVPVPFLTLAAVAVSRVEWTPVRKRLLVLAALSLITLVPCLLWRNHVIHRNVPLWDTVVLKNALTMSRTFLSVFFVPSRSAFHLAYENVSFVLRRDLLPLLAHAAFWTFLFLVSRRWKAGALGLLTFLGPLLPVALVLDMTAVIGERYFYLPLAGFSLWFASLAAEGLLRLRTRTSPRFIATVALCASFWPPLLAVQMAIRTQDWRTESRLFETTVERDPGNYKAYYQLSMACRRNSDRAGEIRYLKTALNLRPDYLPALNNLAVYTIQSRNFPEAKELLDRAFKSAPTRAKTAFNYGYYFESKGDLKQAIPWYRRALELEPKYDKAAEALVRLRAMP
ncbi:MAG: tetratricopeptide repeat protein [Pseudomonadota bacterium]